MIRAGITADRSVPNERRHNIAIGLTGDPVPVGNRSGAIIGTLVFREPFGQARIAATVLVVTGIVLLNVA